MGYKIVSMKKGRRRDSESLTFSRTQLYLVVGSILAIAVLAFSLGHLVTRENAVTPEEKARLESSALPESEVLEEMKRLERRLKGVGEKTNKPEPKKEEKPAAASEKVIGTQEPSISEAPPVQSDGTPIRVKTIETVERLAQAPIEKAVRIKAYKPITRTGPIIAAPVVPVAPPESEEVDEPAVPVAPSRITVVETVQEPPIAPLAPVQPVRIEPEKEKRGSEVAEIRLKEMPAVVGVPKFAVQVGSFPSEAKANMLVRELKGKGYNSYVKKVVRTRAVWYRVRVGAYADRWQAERGAGDLKKNEGLEVLIVAYETP